MWAKAFDFDKELTGNHQQVLAKLGDRDVEVDVKLKELLERINKPLGLITKMSCQYNLSGYATISFDYLSFYRLLELMRTKHFEKYENFTEYCPESLWCAIAMNNDTIFSKIIGDLREECFEEYLCICHFKAIVGEYSGMEDCDFRSLISIGMFIHPKLIDHFVELWDKFFY